MDSQLKILILTVLIALSKQDAVSLQKFMLNSKNTGITVFEPSSFECRTPTNVLPSIWKYVMVCSISSAGVSSDENGYVITSFKTSEGPSGIIEGVVKSTYAPSNLLPFSENDATYLLLDHREWGNYFITGVLSGCDIWIANDENDYDPLVVHVNANDIADPVANLKHKQNLAMATLDYFNQDTQLDYKYIQRVSYNYAKETPNPDDINEYWNEFKEETGIPYTFYYPARAVFFGLYASDEWRFAIKDGATGKIIEKVKCSESCTCCVVS